MPQQIRDEPCRIIDTIKGYLSEEKTTELLIKLDEEIGKKSENPIYKQFFSTLRNIVDKPLPPPPLWLWITFYSLVASHIILVIGVVLSFFILPVYAPWYIAMPVMTFIWFFSTTKVDCQLTNLENAIRTRLGMKKIGGFVGTYFKKPLKLLMMQRRRNKRIVKS